MSVQSTTVRRTRLFKVRVHQKGRPSFSYIARAASSVDCIIFGLERLASLGATEGIALSAKLWK